MPRRGVRGTVSTEYVLVIAVMVVALIFVIIRLGSAMRNTFTSEGARLSNNSNQSASR